MLAGGDDRPFSQEVSHDVAFWAVTAHSSPVSDLIWVLRRLLGLRPNHRVCARTFKGCQTSAADIDDFPGLISCCKEDWAFPEHWSRLYRQGPGESNPGRHFLNLRTFYELFSDVHSSRDTDFIYCDLPPATCALSQDLATSPRDVVTARRPWGARLVTSVRILAQVRVLHAT